MQIMTTRFFARVALIAFAGVIGGCVQSGLPPDGCRVDADCGPHAICVQRICVIDLTREPDLGPRPPDFAGGRDIPNPDFRLSDMDGGDSGPHCEMGTKQCGVINGNIPKCIPNGWCCTNNDCPAAG